MSSSLARGWALPWPQVPTRLWGTIVAVAVVGLSLFFNQEIWPAHPAAVRWSHVVLGTLLQAGGVQLIGVLRVWRNACAGPGWLRLLVWGGVLVAIAGIAFVVLLAFVFTGFSLVRALCS